MSDLNKETWSTVINQINPNDKLNNFLTIYTKLMDKHMPKQRIKFNKYKHKQSNWITKGIINSIKHRDMLVAKLNKQTCNLKKTALRIKLKKHKLKIKL